MLKRAFTLIELLVVIAIIAIIAAILFPVFAQAKAAAYKATCTSNLKNLGVAFLLYAGDYDDLMPSPGGGTRIVDPPNGRVSTGWNQTNADGSGGGIWPYVKSRSLGSAKGNIYSCPNAINYTGNTVGVAPWEDLQRNYIMNDYLRGFHPGTFETNVTNPTPWQPVPFAAGISQTSVPNVANVIVLYEASQRVDGGTNRNGAPYHRRTAGTSSRPPFTIGFPVGFHSGELISNFLYLDGHVGAIRPDATWTQDTNDEMATINPIVWNEVCVPRFKGFNCGSGSRDQWNPESPGVVYP